MTNQYNVRCDICGQPSTQTHMAHYICANIACKQYVEDTVEYAIAEAYIEKLTQPMPLYEEKNE